MRGVIPTVTSLIAGPVLEPLDLEEIKKHLKFASTTEDTLLDVLNASARETFEQEAGVQLMTATYQLGMPCGPACREIELPRPPVQDIVAVLYDDADGAEQTWDPANYELTPSGPFCRRGRLVLAAGVTTWPVTNQQPQALRIQFTAGFGSASGDVPERIKGALYLLLAHAHRNRSEVQDGPLVVIPLGASATIRTYKHYAMPTLEARAWI